MMLQRLFLSGGLALSCNVAFAADVRIQDFGAMTRVTIPIHSSVKFEVKHPSRRVMIAAETTDLGLTAPHVSGNGRLSKLDVWTSEVGSGVDIAFSCACTSSNYRTDEGSLVVDIVENSSAATPVPTAFFVNTVGPTPIVYETFSEGVPPVGQSSAWKAGLVPAKAITRRGNSQRPTQNLPQPTLDGSDESLRLSQVLVATPQPRKRPKRSMPESEIASAVSEIRNAVEAQMNDAASDGRITLQGVSSNQKPLDAECPDEAALDLRRLTDTSDFREALPGLRAAVFDDLKQVNPSAVRALARHFIAFGLGTETQAVIGAFGTEGQSESHIIDMAQFLDGQYGKLGESSLFSKSCGRYAAIWRSAFLAAQGAGSVTEAYLDTDGAVFDLPDPLRKRLGAQIALGLIDEGERETAMRLWRSLETAGGPETSEMRLLKAYVLQSGPSKENALPALAKLAASRLPEAIPAALRAAEILIEGFDQGAADKLLQSLDEIIFVYRGSEFESDLVLAKSKLDARYGDLASALNELDARHLAEPERSKHWEEIIQKTIRSATVGADPSERPSDFTAILNAQVRLDQSPESDEARLALARQLVGSGAAHVVGSVLTVPTLGRSTDARKIMAEASLLMGRSEQALKFLDKASDGESVALRRRAMALGAKDFRTLVNGRFEAVPSAEKGAPLTNARQLLDRSKTDLTLLEEMLEDG